MYTICLFLLCLSLSGTIFAVLIKDECLLVGSSLRVNCISDFPGNSFPSVEWRKNSIFFQNDFLLEITNFSESDTGTYSCLNFSSSIANSIYRLIIYEPIKILSPSNYYPDLGDNIDIVCNATAKPELIYSWFRNGQQLNYPINTQIIPINSVSSDDTGVYECRISNRCGSAVSYISVTINSPDQLSQGALIGIVVSVILCLFLSILCAFFSLVQTRKYLRPIIRGSRSGSSHGSIYSDESKMRRKKSIIHSSSHRNSVTDLFTQEGIVHSNPVFIEGIANEKSVAFSNLIGIPQNVNEDQASHLSLAGSTTGGKHYSSDDLEIKPETIEMMRRSKSLRDSRTEKKEFPSDPPKEKLAPYEHRFSPYVPHGNNFVALELTSKRERSFAEGITETRKIFDNPEKYSPIPASPARLLIQSEIREMGLKRGLVPKKRKISLDDELRVTPGDLSDFLTKDAKTDSESSDEDELIAALPIKMPHSIVTKQFQDNSNILKEFQKKNSELSWDELDQHFHVLDTFVSPATFLAETRLKRVSSAATRPAPNLKSILEESPSMVRMAERSATKLGVKKSASLLEKVSRFDGEGDPWIDGELANIPTRIVATRSKRFDSKYF